MRWKQKAAIMRFCAALPGGDNLYRVGQRRLGRLRANPMGRLPLQAEMARWYEEQGPPIEDAVFLEVGTGHVPVVPIGFYLLGAARVITVDLHRRLDWELTRQCLCWLAIHRSDIVRLYGSGIRQERLAEIVRWQENPQRFLEQASIEYLAPADATDTRLPDNTVDCHFSVTTLEHIPEAILHGIFSEAKRVLKPRGVAIHFIDLSDHFQHQDSSISRINFLRYSELEWHRIAGNEFAYCNRMRCTDYAKLSSCLSFHIIRQDYDVDAEAIRCLAQIHLADRFTTYPLEDLCTIGLRIMLQPTGNSSSLCQASS